jgi:catechol 2,3-dioxygenase-like lactoylglutathione lyase family enzyme
MRVSLDQYCINVSDLARSERFYTEGLGLSVTHRIEIPGVSEVVLEGASGNRIQLAHHHGNDQPIQHGHGLWKLYLNTDDCAGLHARALAAGAESVSDPGSRRLPLRDRADGRAHRGLNPGQLRACSAGQTTSGRLSAES